MSSSAKSKTKSNNASAKSRRPTFSIVVLVAFIVAVFAFIGHRQVRSAEERRLRLLAGFADRIETTVPDLADRFRRITARRCAEQVDDYLDLVPHLEHLSVQTFWKSCSDGDERPRGRESVDVHTEDGEVTARFCRAGNCDFTRGASDEVLEGQWVKAAEARIQLDEVLEPMIIPGIFDLVVIADRSGTVLHQQGEAALKVAHLDALLGHDREKGTRGDQESWTRRIAQEGSDAGRLLLRAVQGEGAGTLAGAAGAPGAATAIVKTKIADADYSVFLQPVILAIEPEEGQPRPAPERWVAVGVISSEHLLSAGVTTSPILLFLLVSILPLGLIAWPFLKLALISRRQPFTRLDCAFLVLATVLALSFGALLLVDGLLVTRVQATVDRQLADLSRVIDRNFRMELLDAWRQLDALNRDVKLDEDDEDEEVRIAGVPNYFDEAGDAKAGGQEDQRDGEEGSAEASEGEGVGTQAQDNGAESTRRSARKFIAEKVEAFLWDVGEPRMYPYFDSVFWPDADGNVEGAAVPLREHAVLPQNVDDREYVLCAREWRDKVILDLSDCLKRDRSECLEEAGGQRAPTLLDAYERTRCTTSAKGSGLSDGCTALDRFREDEPIEICLDSLLDRTTGEAVAALSVRAPEHLRCRSSRGSETSSGVEASCEADEELARPTAALVTQLTSLHHPVLPPEVQFAVVEPSGDVLFHSDSRRALTENFLEASDENSLLRALLQNRREGDLTLHYWGRRHRAYLRPIPGLPWSLVVFRGIEDLRLRNFELIYDFLNPFVLHLAVLALLAGAFKWIAPRRFRAYLWPSTQNLAAYRRIVWWTLRVSLLFVVLLAADGLPPWWLFLASFLVAPVTFLYVVWFLPARHRALEGKASPVGWRVPLSRRFRERLPKLETLRRGVLDGRWSPRHCPAVLRSGLGRGLDRIRALGRGSHREESPQSGEDTRQGQETDGPQDVRQGQETDGDQDARQGEEAHDEQDSQEGSDTPARGGETSSGGGATGKPRDVQEELRRRRRLRWLLFLPGAALTFAGLLAGLDAMAAWLFGVAWAAGVGLWWFWPEFDGSRRRIAYTFALGCMLLLSLLPVLGFLDLARSRQTQLALQDTAVALAHRLEVREREIDGRQGPLTSYYEDYQEDELRCARDSYLAAAGGAILEDDDGEYDPTCLNLVGGAGGRTVFSDEALPTGEDSGSWLWPYGRAERADLSRVDRWVVRTLSARPVSLNDLSPRPAGIDLSRFRARVGSWERGAGGGDGKGEWVVLTDPGEALPESLRRLATALPEVDAFPHGSVRRALVFGLGLVLLGGAPFLLGRYLAKKLFLVDLVYAGEDPVAGQEGSDGETRAGRVAASRPGESLEDVLDEARKGRRTIRRLVIVAGQLDREGWDGMVAEPEDEEGPAQPGTGSPESGQASDVPDFHEARFREAWEEVLAQPAEAPREGNGAGEPPASEAPPGEANGEGAAGATQGAPPSRSRRFEKALTRGASEGRPILLTHFAPDLHDVQAAVDQTVALRNLVERDRRSMVILSDVVPVTTDEAPGVRESETAVLRWIEFLGSFPVRYARDFNHLEKLHERAGDARTMIEEKWQEDQQALEQEGPGRYGSEPNESGAGPSANGGTSTAAGGPEADGRKSTQAQWAKAQHWHWIVDAIESECKHTPTLRVLGHQLLDELFVDVKRKTLKDRIRDLETEPERIREREWNLEVRLQRILAERSKAREQEVEDGKARGTKIEGGSSEELRAQVTELTGELRELRLRSGKIPGDLKKARRRLARIEERADYRNLLTEDHVLSRIGASARLHYRYLWSHCNRDEMLVLVQLAQQGLVNPKSFGWVLDLMQRGLVVRAPDLRLMNRSFRRFVLQEFRRSDVLEWEEELGPNAWSVLKWILPFPILALAGFLFITQRDAVSNAAGVLVALASLTPVVFNLYGKFQEVNLRRERREAPAEEG